MADVAAEQQASSGHQLEKRKRGRPRKLTSDQSEDPKPKRPRGRPKGSKNKRPSKKDLMKKQHSKMADRRNKSGNTDDIESDGAGDGSKDDMDDEGTD